MASAIAALALLRGTAADSFPSRPAAVVVSNPKQFQNAVRQGVPHIVIGEHLDMTETPRFSDVTIMDSGMIAVVPNGNDFTTSIQGNCSGAPQFDLPPLDPPLAQERRQCLIYVREDFLETPLQDSHLWLSNLYVTMPGVEKNHSTLIGAHGGDVYMTDITFVADGDKARAVDVKEGRRVYIADSYFSNFSKDKDGVIRLEPGARATVLNTAFVNNSVATGKPDAVASGPVMGLYSGLSPDSSPGAAAWFQNCTFAGSLAAVAGEIAVESRACQVFTSTALPTVWDRELSEEVDAWPLVARPEGEPEADVFMNVSGGGAAFPRPDDPAFVRILTAHEALTGLPVDVTALPNGIDFVTVDPYAGVAGPAAVAEGPTATGAVIDTDASPEPTDVGEVMPVVSGGDGSAAAPGAAPGAPRDVRVPVPLPAGDGETATSPSAGTTADGTGDEQQPETVVAEDVANDGQALSAHACGRFAVVGVALLAFAAA